MTGDDPARHSGNAHRQELIARTRTILTRRARLTAALDDQELTRLANELVTALNTIEDQALRAELAAGGGSAWTRPTAQPAPYTHDIGPDGASRDVA